jgi:hypothetical protein
MKSAIVLLMAVAAYARPQEGGPAVNCERREVAPGKYEYACAANPGALISESTLWVPTSSSDQDLLIRVPNYQLREIIRAGLQAGAAGGTNVRVHVARPEIESIVEGKFEQGAALAPNVQVVYDALQQRGEVHYGGSGSPYRTLSKEISEPSG